MASPSFDFAAVAGVELPPNVGYVGIRHRDASLPVGRTLNMLSRNRFTADTGSLRIRTCRICRAVRAFDPSGVQVNSAESDSAVGCKHSEFESSHGQVSSLLARRGIADRGEHIKQPHR
jgi:hypothetical protein